MKNRSFTSIFAVLALLLFVGTMSPGCAKVSLAAKKVFIGDPRKNPNHPKHGDYVREKRMKKHGY